MASELGVAPVRASREYTIELIDTPQDLPADRAEQINLQIAGLACRACGGTDAEDPVVVEGWRNYCMNPGGRIQDDDRAVVAWDGGRLVGFGCWVVCPVEPDATVLWWKAAGVDPDYQGRRAFAEIVPVMMDHSWLLSFPPPTHFVMRT